MARALLLGRICVRLNAISRVFVLPFRISDSIWLYAVSNNFISGHRELLFKIRQNKIDERYLLNCFYQNLIKTSF